MKMLIISIVLVFLFVAIPLVVGILIAVNDPIKNSDGDVHYDPNGHPYEVLGHSGDIMYDHPLRY